MRKIGLALFFTGFVLCAVGAVLAWRFLNSPAPHGGGWLVAILWEHDRPPVILAGVGLVFAFTGYAIWRLTGRRPGTRPSA